MAPTTSTTRGCPIKVKIISDGQEISTLKLKGYRLIAQQEDNESTTVQLHPDATAMIYKAAVRALLKSSQTLMQQKELVTNLVMYSARTPSEDQELASIDDHDFVFLSIQDDTEEVDIFDETDLLTAIQDATDEDVGIDILVNVDYVVNAVQEGLSERIHLKKGDIPKPTKAADSSKTSSPEGRDTLASDAEEALDDTKNGPEPVDVDNSGGPSKPARFANVDVDSIGPSRYSNQDARSSTSPLQKDNSAKPCKKGTFKDTGRTDSFIPCLIKDETTYPGHCIIQTLRYGTEMVSDNSVRDISHEEDVAFWESTSGRDLTKGRIPKDGRVLNGYPRKIYANEDGYAGESQEREPYTDTSMLYQSGSGIAAIRGGDWTLDPLRGITTNLRADKLSTNLSLISLNRR